MHAIVRQPVDPELRRHREQWRRRAGEFEARHPGLRRARVALVVAGSAALVAYVIALVFG